MKVIGLAIAFIKERTARTILTTTATAVAVCMVIWVTSSYEALHKTYDEYADVALGRYQLAIAPVSGEPTDLVPPEVLPVLRSDPAVLDVEPMWAGRIAIIEGSDPTGQPAGSRSHASFPAGAGTGPNSRLPSLLFIATAASESPFPMREGTWLDTDGTPSVVLRADVASRRGMAIGDELTVELPRPNEIGENTLTLPVVGTVDAPSLVGAEAVGIPFLTPSSAEAFISIPVHKQITGEAFQIRMLGVSVAPSSDINEFRFGWAPKLSRYEVPLQFQEAFEIEEALDQAAAAQNVRLQSYAATAVAMLVAVCVTFCSLSVGVTERIRQYAILRSVALTRVQIGWLIITESLVLGASGLAAGLVLGWGVLAVAEGVFGQVLYHGLVLGVHSLGLATIAALGGSLLAAIIPAYRATRVKPIDAMTPQQPSDIGSSITWQSIVVATLLIVGGASLTYVFPPGEHSVGWTMTGTLALLTVGFIALAPSVVVLVDRLIGPILATLFGFDAKLLSSQLANNVWRTVGASVSMSFGLSLFIGIQVWGVTMLEAFVPGSWTPDAIAMLTPGIAPDRSDEISRLQGIDAARCLPLVVEQPRLVDDITHSAEKPSVTRQDNVVLVGLDPEGAFAGDRPLLQLDWVAGSPETAIAALKRGRGCVVPDHFLAETGLRIGDQIALSPPRNSGQPVCYEIAGAVRLQGWHWQTKLSGLRTRTHRAAALVFADYPSVAADFDLPLASHVWFSYADDFEDVETIESSLRTVLETTSAESASHREVEVRVVPVQAIRDHLQGAARRWLWIISVVPLITLLIACLGVLNVISAAVRARYWEYGVLRSIGFSGSDLAKAIFAEGLMIALVASLLSVGFGVLMGWCGVAMAQYVSFFGGLYPPLVIPWQAILGGVLCVWFLGMLTAAWPACSLRRTRAMKLLQAGGQGI